jgi:uncharacterized membrane protein required for colicin V production
MLDLVLLFILGFGFFIGLKRGFILQIVHLAGFIIAFIVAALYYNELAPKLTLWIPFPNISTDATFSYVFENINLEATYYRAISFAILFLVVKLLCHIIGSMLEFLAKIPVLKQLNVWAGGLLGFIEVYVIMFIILFIAALLPIDSIQTTLTNSILAELIIKSTPILSQEIQELWISKPTTI